MAPSIAGEYPPVADRAAIEVRLVRLIVLVLLVALATLTPLCHASPSDPTWLAGLYDDADYDDVVLEVIATVAVPTAEPPHLLAPVVTGPVVAGVVREAPSKRSLIAPLDRAPPLA